MGTTQAHKQQRHANAQKFKQRQRRAHVPSAKGPEPNLWRKLPRAGMRYPFRGGFMRRQRGDIGVWSAIKKTAPKFTTAMLDTIFSRIFEEATKMLQEDKDKQLPRNPLDFMKLLRKRPSLREPWLRRQAHFLLTVFIILRAARGNWRKDPRPPADIEKHCKTARAIDAFLAEEDFYWSSLSTVEYFVDEKGGLDLIRPVKEDNSEEEQEQPDTEEGVWDGEKGRDEEILAKEAVPASDKPSCGLKISLGLLLEGMRRLNIDVDETALTEAFAKLGVDGAGAVAAPDGAGSPLLEDSDDDVVL